MALAPMEDVTDTVFRELIMSVSDPDRLQVVFTEFTSVDGLCHDTGREKVSERLRVTGTEESYLTAKNIKIVAQLWGSDPEKFFRAGRMISDNYSFAGIDINMGCPVKKIIKHGSCSALIKQPMLAAEIIQAAKEGSGMSVSVKTRIGFHHVVTESWVSHLLDTPVDAITLHARTQRMLSEGQADWNEVAKAVKLRNDSGKSIAILGNGDVMSYNQAKILAEKTGADGVMIGRGIFSNPWLFGRDDSPKLPEEKLDLLCRHVELFIRTFGDSKHFAILKRFFKIYIQGFTGASSLRKELMNTTGIGDVQRSLRRFRDVFDRKRI